MGKYSNYSDIEAVISKANDLLEKIENEYQKNLQNQSIAGTLLVEIKDFLGNLRSALDYIFQKKCKQNFPICDNIKDFNNRTQKIPIDIKQCIEKWQPLNNNKWMKWFNVLNNKNKHLTLIPQKKIEVSQIRVTHPQSGSASWLEGVKFGAGAKVMGALINPVTQLPFPDGIVKTEKIVWVDFTFDNSALSELTEKISVVSFLKEAFINIVKIVKEIESIN